MEQREEVSVVPCTAKLVKEQAIKKDARFERAEGGQAVLVRRRAELEREQLRKAWFLRSKMGEHVSRTVSETRKVAWWCS